MHKSDMKREKAYRRKQRKNKIDAERFICSLNKMCSEAKKVSESLKHFVDNEVKFKEE